MPHATTRRPLRFQPGIETYETRILPSGGRTPAGPPTPPPIIDPIPDPAVPLPDMTGTYLGEDGGLYGGYSNVPPPSQALLGDKGAAAIQPLDARGRPSDQGRVGMLAIGQSTTHLIFATFQKAVASMPNRSDALTLVNGAQDGMVLQYWSNTSGPWGVAANHVRQAGLTRRQIQVVWIEVAEIRSWQYGDFAARQAHIVSDVARVMRRVMIEYPNVKLAFLTSRPYGGYAPGGIDPEPYAYQSGFAVRKIIRDQIQGNPDLNPDPARGKVAAPVMLWGPYDWADGATPSSTGLTWLSTDFSDGIHPNASGTSKAALLMIKFFSTDPRARTWFLK